MGSTSWDFFTCPIECPHIFGRDPSAYLYIQDTALLYSNFPSLTSCSLNTYLIFSFYTEDTKHVTGINGATLK
jgi:hypothetical protein